jgi:hypothetical protein
MIMLSLLKPYRLPITAGLSVAITFGAYFKGRADSSAKWLAKIQAAEIKMHQAEARSDSLTMAIRQAEQAELNAVTVHASNVAVRIVEHKQDFDRIQIPETAIALHNEAARGSR